MSGFYDAELVTDTYCTPTCCRIEGKMDPLFFEEFLFTYFF